MIKSVTKRVAIILFTLTIFFLLSSNNCAKFVNIANNKKGNCKIEILSGTKELNGKHEIFFKVQDNENVKSDKFAPGLKAVAEIEIDIIDLNEPVDIIVNANTSNLDNSFKFTSKINDINYNLGTLKTITSDENMLFSNENGRLIFSFEIEWLDSINNEEQPPVSKDKIKIPFNVKINQHIG